MAPNTFSEDSAESENPDRKRKISEVEEPIKKPRLDDKEASDKKKEDFCEDLADLQLGQVLKELKIVELLKSEGVSKKWRNAALNFAWPAIHEISPENMCEEQDKPLEMDKKKLCFLLKRGGNSIWKLDLGSIRLETTGTKIVTLTPNVTYLGLSGIRLTVGGARALIPLGPKLKTLDFGNISIYKPAMESVANLVGACPILENLYLGDNACLWTDLIFEALPPTLSCLHLSHAFGSSFAYLALIAKRCPQLKEFRFWEGAVPHYCRGFNFPDNVFDFLRRLSSSLSVLELGGIRSESTAAVIEHLPNLTYLKLYRTYSFQLFPAICRACAHIQELHVDYLSVPNRHNISAWNELPELHTLHASGSFEDDDFIGLSHRGKLQLFQCERVTNKSIQAVIENCPDLKSVNLWKCEQVNRVTLEAWFNEFKKRHAADRPKFPVISWTKLVSKR